MSIGPQKLGSPFKKSMRHNRVNSLISAVKNSTQAYQV